MIKNHRGVIHHARKMAGSMNQTPTVITMSNDSLQKRIIEIGTEIFARSKSFSTSFFDKRFFSDVLMAWTMKHPQLKVELFRFVDALPVLETTPQITKHLREYLLDSGVPFPLALKSALVVALSNPITALVAAQAVKKNVARMARAFITGEDAATAKNQLRSLWRQGTAFTVDILGEAAVSENEAIHYQKRYMNLIEILPPETVSWPLRPGLEKSPLGLVPRVNVSVKCSSLYSQIDMMAFDFSLAVLKERLRPILRSAMAHGVFVNLDMEQNDHRELFLTLAEEIFLEKEFSAYPHFGLVIQAYLKCAQEDLARVICFAQKRQTPLTVRLVKGAYWDYEVALAVQRGWPIPVYTEKNETDAHYERCTDGLFDAYPHVLAAFGSHNVRSLAHAMAMAEKLKLDKTDFEIQMLYGMADPFKRAIADLGYRVRQYVPVGELLPGMAYLVRRLLENTSNEGFLRARFVDHKAAPLLLADPAYVKSKSVPKPPILSEKKKETLMFENQAYLDFSLATVRHDIATALKKMTSLLPLQAGAIVGGKSVAGLKLAVHVNPSRREETVTEYALSTSELADRALQIALEAGKSWAKKPVESRAKILASIAEILLKRRYEFIALMTLEVGKNFKEADADVCEAIDFCRYYAQEATTLLKKRVLANLPGESDFYEYGPRGVSVVIAPWNFPLAILCGMTVAALVCGNPVIIKPAEQSSGVAKLFFDVLLQAGVDAGVAHFLPGLGDVVGAHLVKSSHVHIISFTGSRAVGLSIIADAARMVPGQKHIKKVVAEMGGKNAVIIDDDADLDEAVVGCLQSAFGFSGQKCSALSRIIIVKTIYERFKKRLVDAFVSLSVGTADDVAKKIGPVIDEEAQQRLLAVIKKHRKDIVAQIELTPEFTKQGFFVPPTIFTTTDFKSDLGQQEFFGPLVTLFSVNNLSEAIEAANDVDYALTGGIFSRSPAHIEKVKREFEVGNLYINRGITGALVNRQPFGGFKLSGVGGKAGGPDYLRHFVEARSITENTMRRGFIPEI